MQQVVEPIRYQLWEGHKEVVEESIFDFWMQNIIMSDDRHEELADIFF